MKKVLAFDFGASSGRGILGIYDNGELKLEEVHRFPNYPIEKAGKLSWDTDYLFGEVIKGIHKASRDNVIDSIGVDTWGIDFGMLDKNGVLLAPPRSYRDPITAGVIDQIARKIDLAKLYQGTGNQIMEINTLFQLFITKQADPKLFKQVDKILFMPDLFNYLLTGNVFAEKSIASTAQMVNAKTTEWATDILAELDIPAHILPTLVDAEHFVGYTKPELDVGKIPVFNVCEHDTASAVVSVPNNQNFLFVSCGTWSLVGTELAKPIINEDAYKYNLTNESGINRTTTFLKNLTGLWIVQELRRNFKEAGRIYSFNELAVLAAEAARFKCFIDPDNNLFTAPGSMIKRIQFYAQATNQEIPRTDGELIRCAYESLAMKYKLTFMEISAVVKHDFDIVNIVGGGSQAGILCQMVADASNIRVEAGPVEATAIGNIAVQLLAQNEFKDIQAIREWIKNFAQTKYYFPTKNYQHWDREFSRFQVILNIKGVDELVKQYS